MGNPDYEDRRNSEREQRDRAAKEAAVRNARHELSEEVGHMMVTAMKDFLEGRACFISEKIGDVQTRIVFVRGN